MIKALNKLFKKIFKPQPCVAIIKLTGIIGETNYTRSCINFDIVRDKIKYAFEIKKVKAVIFRINSPGGSPVQSELIHNHIVYLAQKHNVPAIAYVEDMAASGGYWIAVAANHIIAAKNSIIGSIGVISSGFGFNKAIEKLGIERRVYTEGKSKAILDPFMPQKETDIKIIKAIQQQIHQNFKDVILKNRKKILKKNYDTIFSGEFWVSQDALQFKLIDEINDLNQFIYKKYGNKIKIRDINFDKSWLKSKIGIITDTIFDGIFAKIEERLNKINFN